MPKIDLDAVPQTNRTDYPAPFDAAVQGRWYRRLAPSAGLTAFGASHVVLKPGALSSQRHWHRGEDELLVMLAGEAVLVEDEGETVLRPGDCAAWAAGVENGHHLQNRTDTDAVFLVIGGGTEQGGDYPDIDMCWDADSVYRHKDGTAYPTSRQP